MALVGVERRVSVGVFLRHFVLGLLGHVGVNRQKLITHDADEVESVVRPTADDPDAFFELKDRLEKANLTL